MISQNRCSTVLRQSMREHVVIVVCFIIYMSLTSTSSTIYASLTLFFLHPIHWFTFFLSQSLSLSLAKLKINIKIISTFRSTLTLHEFRSVQKLFSCHLIFNNSNISSSEKKNLFIQLHDINTFHFRSDGLQRMFIDFPFSFTFIS